MRWKLGRRSSNIEDRRGMGGRGVVVGGGGGMLVLAVVVLLMGGDPTQILMQSLNDTQGRPAAPTAEQQEQMDFLSSVLGSTEDVWNAEYPGYRNPTLVVFTGAVDSACGMGQAAMGPFYCPLDEKLYLDLSFFQDLENQLNAPGDFARAYVVAHEVGHHIQTLSGTSGRVREGQARASRKDGNALSVKLELQADCLAGVWAHHAQAQYGLLEPGDIDEALNAASQIGDDRLQQQSGGRVVPDSFTHGSAAQRRDWFEKGYRGGAMENCDTFGGKI